MKYIRIHTIVLLFIFCSIDITKLSIFPLSQVNTIENVIYSCLIVLLMIYDLIDKKASKANQYIKIQILVITLILFSVIAKGGISSTAIVSTLRLCISFVLFSLYTFEYNIYLKRFIVFLPIFSLIVGIIFTLLGIRNFYSLEYTGAYRLQGAKMAAHFALICVPAILLTLYEISKGRSRYYWYILFANIVLLMLTYTRMPLLIVGLIFVFFIFRRIGKKKYRTYFFMALVFVIPTAIYYGGNLYEKMLARSIGEDGELNDSGRSVVWELLYDKIIESPYFGYGGGESTKYLMEKSEYFKAPHNEYLQYSFNYGLIGLFLILFYLFGNFAKVRNGEFRTYIYIVFLLLAITDNPLSTMAFQVPFFLLVNIMQREKNTVLL